MIHSPFFSYVNRDGSTNDCRNPNSVYQPNNSSAQSRPAELIPYADLTSSSGTPNHSANSGKYVVYSAGNFTYTIQSILACRYAPTKSAWKTLLPRHAASVRNTFNRRNDARGAELSSSGAPVSKSPRMAIRTFNLSTMPSDRSFVFIIARIGRQCSP